MTTPELCPRCSGTTIEPDGTVTLRQPLYQYAAETLRLLAKMPPDIGELLEQLATELEAQP